jgi:hypothetical protein
MGTGLRILAPEQALVVIWGRCIPGGVRRTLERALTMRVQPDTEGLKTRDITISELHTVRSHLRLFAHSRLKKKYNSR